MQLSAISGGVLGTSRHTGMRFGQIQSALRSGLNLSGKEETSCDNGKSKVQKPFYKKLMAPFLALAALLPFTSGCVENQSSYTSAPSVQNYSSPSSARQEQDNGGSNFGIGTNGKGYLNPSGESGGIGFGFDGKMYMDMGGIGIPLN